MAFQRKPSTRIVLGIPELDKRLEGLELAVANRVARGALSKGARLAAKKIKAAVPGKHKHIRKAIGSSVKKVKSGPNKGFTQAKAGAAVGKKAAKAFDVFEAKMAHQKAGKGGVGISAANIHWYILGTQNRTVKKTGQHAGQMPPNPIVKQAMATGKSQVLQEVKVSVAEGIERERKKLVAKHNLKHGH